ncbi:MAG: DUF1957 domain-containing protein [Clostridia bacterium]|nr:MAG: DUF1957 domain-containing protein [Clostridia bacterium]
MAVQGYLALVLHSHLPFVRHQRSRRLQERWLFEAIHECYLPLLDALDRLVQEGVNFRLTLSLSPPLITMLDDHLLQDRFSSFLDDLLELSAREIDYLHASPALRSVAEFYHQRFLHWHELYHHRYGGDLVGAFARLARSGNLELITSAATHAYLPLVHTPEGRHAQVEIALELYRRRFGRDCPGFWLPECAFTPGLDSLLREYGIRYFIVDTHCLAYAAGSEAPDIIYQPLACPAGVAALARDPESSQSVWNRWSGYPGDPVYREFYRDIGYERAYAYLRPYLPPGVSKADTGLKYYRITGDTEAKEPYDPAAAALRAGVHARNFMFNREKQVEFLARNMQQPPLVVSPYDTELFGHWWFEGPIWLEELCRAVAGEQDTLAMTTISRYLDGHPPAREGNPGLASWGEGGYSHVWLNPSNDWIYRHLHQAEKTMVYQAATWTNPPEMTRRALNQMARELLLAQGSDWPFILNAGTDTGYATRRVVSHLLNFSRLARQVEAQAIDTKFLTTLEGQDNLFPFMDYRVYRPRRPMPAYGPPAFPPAGPRHARALMLTWEYPPRVVGGIAPHVHDLSEALARQGTEVDIITIAEVNSVTVEHRPRIHIYRLPVWPAHSSSFREWVFQFNLSMLDFLENNVPAGRAPWQVIHAHDWLVAYAAVSSAQAYGLPLVATIHATEYGRNHGVFTEEQQAIHQVESWLVGQAAQVICCSQYMAREITTLFSPAAGKVHMVPNGVDLPATGDELPPDERNWPDNTRLVLFVGRLVPEKGVQTLLAAAPSVLAGHPEAHFVIAGNGPYEPELRRMAWDLGLGDRVTFAGFVGARTRNWLLSRAEICVFPSLYEPFGIVALEAMAAGRPVVAAASGGLAEIITHGQDGLLFPPGKAPALAAALIQLLDEPELARYLGRQGREKVKRLYNWDDIARATQEVYSLAVTAGAAK